MTVFLLGRVSDCVTFSECVTILLLERLCGCVTISECVTINGIEYKIYGMSSV